MFAHREDADWNGSGHAPLCRAPAKLTEGQGRSAGARVRQRSDAIAVAFRHTGGPSFFASESRTCMRLSQGARAHLKVYSPFCPSFLSASILTCLSPRAALFLTSFPLRESEPLPPCRRSIATRDSEDIRWLCDYEPPWKRRKSILDNTQERNRDSEEEEEYTQRPCWRCRLSHGSGMPLCCW